MRLTLLSGAAVALTLMAAPQLASAQAQPAAGNPDAVVPALDANSPSGAAASDAQASSMDSPPAPSASSAASDVAASEPAIPMSSPTPVDQQSSLTANSPSVVSNGPVADTPENRAKYGAPMSNAGKRTAPRGN